MKMGDGRFSLRLAVISFGVLLLLSGIVIAAHIILATPGINGFTSRNEDVSTMYNFTINNTDVPADSTGNISTVNITLPSGFIFISNTNFTNAAGSTFSNNSTGTYLVWTNLSTPGLVGNGTWKYFSFNATATTPGTYNFTVVTTNATGVRTNNTISVTINDTTAPSAVDYDSTLSAANGANQSRTNIPVNITVTDNYLVDRITVRLILLIV